MNKLVESVKEARTQDFALMRNLGKNGDLYIKICDHAISDLEQDDGLFLNSDYFPDGAQKKYMRDLNIAYHTKILAYACHLYGIKKGLPPISRAALRLGCEVHDWGKIKTPKCRLDQTLSYSEKILLRREHSSNSALRLGRYSDSFASNDFVYTSALSIAWLHHFPNQGTWVDSPTRNLILVVNIMDKICARAFEKRHHDKITNMTKIMETLFFEVVLNFDAEKCAEGVYGNFPLSLREEMVEDALSVGREIQDLENGFSPCGQNAIAAAARCGA